MQTKTHRHILPLAPISAAAFEPFGQIIEAGGSAAPVSINDGFAQRFDSSAVVDTAQGNGAPRVSIYRNRPRVLPIKLSVVERHLLGSQLFMPLGAASFVVVVALAGPVPVTSALHAFLVSAGRGVNLRPGTWHHPLLALDGSDFLVVDRRGTDGVEDCEVHSLALADAWVEG